MVRLRALKSLKYATRRLMAGDEFDASRRDAKLLKLIRKAEDAPLRPLHAPRRGRPPKSVAVAPEPEPQPEPEEKPLEERTVAELREMAEARGIELPPTYVRRDELIEKITSEGASDPEEPHG